ncbi:MAG: site-specific DNA-methyltransferase [Gammaproteobacteria bacterium]|nr:site-specific DNA-methyltransferase [Gammaproteobacteria bacterium]
MLSTATIAWQSQSRESVLYRGDQLEVMALLPEASVDCIWTDPPYLLSNDGTTCVAGRRTTVNKGTWDRSQGLTADHEFNKEWLTACYRLLKPSGTIWVTGTLHVYLSVGMAMLELGYRVINDIIWEKPNPPPNLGCRCFTHATELILWATKAKKGNKKPYTFNYKAMRKVNGGKQMQNVWRMPTPGASEKRYGKHPTQKPLQLIERCLKASTHRGDQVFDPFAGSGSTGVAALLLNRRFVGCERDPKFVRIAVKRLAEIEHPNATSRRQRAR